MDGERPSFQSSVNSLMARLNRIPSWSLPTSFLVIIGIGYFFTFYDISDIGFAMPAIESQFSIPANGFISLFLALSTGLIGYAIGSYVIGSLADLQGRFRSMVLTMGLTALGSFGDALSVNIPMLVVFRFITGLGLGADLNLVTSYIAEFAPPESRGRITVYTFMVGIVGQAITPFVALGLVHETGPGWRVLFLIGGIIAVIALALRFQLPESPRWLLMRKRDVEGAEKVIERMEKAAESRTGKLPEPVVQEIELEESTRFPTRYLLRRPYSFRLAVLAGMWFFWYIGNYGFLGDAATLVNQISHNISSSILYIAIGAIGYPVGAAIMILSADRFERKYIILADTVIWLAGMLIFSFANTYAFFIGSFVASLSLGMYLQVAYTFTAESYPTRARTSGFALTDGIGHGGGAVGAILLPVLVSAYSFSFGFIFIGITGLIAGLFALAGPIATRQSLEVVSGEVRKGSGIAVGDNLFLLLIITVVAIGVWAVTAVLLL